jgi:TRAP-type transport system periplasmic protein
MDEEQFNEWLEVARRSSYKHFAEQVPGGEELIEKALAVD